MVLENILQYGAENILLTSLAIFAFSAILGHVVSYLMNNVVRKVTQRTKTTWDDVLLEALDRPILIFAYAAGVWLGLHTLGLNIEKLGQWYSIYRAILVSIAAYALILTSRRFFSLYDQKVLSRGGSPFGSQVIPLAQKIAPVLIIFSAFVIILDIFDVNVTPLLAGAGIAGLAIGFAFQDTLSNFFAGLYIMADQPIREGDYIKIDGTEEGYVLRVGWRSTWVRTLPNNIVVVPNSRITQSIITNYNLPETEMSVVIPVSVGYNSDLKRVENVVVEVAESIIKSTKGAVENFTPFIRYGKFGESGVEFAVILRVREFVDKFLLTHEFIKALHARFKKDGIEIPYPKRDVFVRKARGA